MIHQYSTWGNQKPEYLARTGVARGWGRRRGSLRGGTIRRGAQARTNSPSMLQVASLKSLETPNFKYHRKQRSIHVDQPIQRPEGPEDHHLSSTGMQRASKQIRAGAGDYVIGRHQLWRGPFDRIEWAKIGLTCVGESDVTRPALQRNPPRVHREEPERQGRIAQERKENHNGQTGHEAPRRPVPVF